MRFLFEYVSCCMISNHRSSACSPGNPSSTVTPTTEETRSLVTPAPSTEIFRRRKRTPSRVPAADWRPSLLAISEDTVVPVAAQKAENRTRPAPAAAKPPAQRNVKRCGPSSARVNAHAHAHARDFRHEPIQMVIPAFSATPFLF